MTGQHSWYVNPSRSVACGMLLVLACCTPAYSQLDGFQDLTGLKTGVAGPKAQFDVTLTPSTAKPGDEVTLTVKVTLPKGHYIYSTTGAFDGRTRIETKETGLMALAPEFVSDREPKTSFEPDLKVEVSKFHDHVTWTKKYRILPDADPSRVSVSGELTGQYCSEGAGGKCTPLNPPITFDVALADAVPEPPKAPLNFEFQKRPKSGKSQPALLKLKLSPDNAKPGEKVTLSVTMELEKGWHIFAVTQPKDGGKPTEIDLTELNGLRALGEGFVADHPYEVDRSLPGTIQWVHHDQVTWSREFEVLADASPGGYGLKGMIIYQTCNSNRCIPFPKLRFELPNSEPVTREAPAVSDVPPPPTTKSPQEASAANPKAAPAPGENAVPNAITKKPQDRGLFGFLLTAIGFGLVSLLTPCVFPMVPITVSFFLKQSESEHHRPIYVALVFCGSIVATFTILGVGISALFGAAQLNTLANNPWLNVAIGTVFVVFALNMLGLFEIRIPSGLLTFTANKEQAGGYVGAMFMALTFTLTSFTCTFAFAGSLLVAASQGQYYWPIIGMLAFGAAFASPFFFLALVPSLLKKLPKSGGWMNVVKVVMGLIEIGAAVKFFSVADFNWNPAEPLLFDYVFVMITWLVLSLTIAMYLLGVFRLSHDVPPVGISVGRLILVIAFLGLSGNLAIALVTHDRGGGWVMEQILALAPPRNETNSPAHGGTTTALPDPVINHHGIWYSLDVDKALEYAQTQQQPLLFDFTGTNCPNCRKMELKFTRPHNRSRLEKFVLVQLYTDIVQSISDPVENARLLKRNQELQIGFFNDASLPAYAIVTPDGKTILAAFTDGLELKNGDFAAFLDEGWAKWEAMGGK